MSNNNISAIPNDFSNLTQISILSLNNNPFSSIHAVIDSLKTLPNLKKLNLNLQQDDEAEYVLSSLPQLEFLNEQGTNIFILDRSGTS